MLRARQNGGGTVRKGGGRGNGNGSPGGRGNNSGPSETAQTWDPANKGNGTVLSNGNLTCDLLGYQDWALSTGSKTTGKWYFELEIVSWAAFSAFSFGIVESNQNPENTVAAENQGNMMRVRSSGWSPALTPVNNGIAFSAGDIAGFAVDLTTNPPTVQCYLNNSAVNGGNGTAQGTSTSGAWKIGAIQTWNNGLSAVINLRTISSQFTYSPPSGYTSWGTA